MCLLSRLLQSFAELLSMMLILAAVFLGERPVSREVLGRLPSAAAQLSTSAISSGIHLSKGAEGGFLIVIHLWGDDTLCLLLAAPTLLPVVRKQMKQHSRMDVPVLCRVEIHPDSVRAESWMCSALTPYLLRSLCCTKYAMHAHATVYFAVEY